MSGNRRSVITTPIYALTSLPPDVPQWGAEFKQALAHHFTRNLTLSCAGTSLPMESNSITLDEQVTDRFGRPALRMTYRDHDDDLALQRFLVGKAEALLDAAGAEKHWSWPVEPQVNGAHLLGTCRMGDDPATSVVDSHHRSHDIPNLFICDGSSLVTSGRGQPTMTIMALAFRAAEHIARFARRGEV